MDRVVYLLGAGFSAPLGIPVMSNFIEKSKDMYFDDIDRYGYFKEVFDTIRDISYAKRIFSTDLDNIEDILSILEMRSQLITGEAEEEEEVEQEERRFEEYIVDVIKHFTPEIQPLARPKVQLAIGYPRKWQLYGFFVASLHRLDLRRVDVNRNTDFTGQGLGDPEIHYSVVTVNYDRVLENAGSLIHERFGEMQGFERRPDLNNLYERVTPLSKIHGSIDDDRIIPPTWNKGLVGEEIKAAWKLAYAVLRDANYIRIIGYSLPESDSYIKYLLQSAIPDAKDVSHVKQIDVLCYDPDGSVKKRYDSFIDWPNYRFVSGRTEDYLQGIANYTMREAGARIPVELTGTPIIEIPDFGNRARDIDRITFDQIEPAHEEFFRMYS